MIGVTYVRYNIVFFDTVPTQEVSMLCIPMLCTTFLMVQGCESCGYRVYYTGTEIVVVVVVVL